MLNALKSFRRTQPRLFSRTLANQIGPKNTSIRMMQQGGRQQQQQAERKKSMEQNEKASSARTTDTMSSFGEGYASRSDEEGFGGVYGGNQYLNKHDEEQIIDGKSSAHDASQGSVVKETEKSRHQK